MLDCCQPLEQTKLKGMTLQTLHCLAQCNGAQSVRHYGDAISVENFREDAQTTCSSAESRVLLLSYDRKTVRQSGSGHFSPVGGYNPDSDMLLILDVARFKYPPHWLPLQMVYEALQPLDSDSGRCRGYLLLAPTADMIQRCCTTACDPSSDETTNPCEGGQALNVESVMRVAEAVVAAASEAKTT